VVGQGRTCFFFQPSSAGLAIAGYGQKPLPFFFKPAEAG
jgi:hypothetical protein